jgi:hypothetical protein
MQAAWKLLNSEATKQLLIYYVAPNLSINTAYHTAFMQEYERVGFPQQCLNVAASLGNGSAAIQFPSYTPIINVNGYYHGDYALLLGNFWGNIVLWDPEVFANIKVSALANRRAAEYYSDHLFVRKYVFGVGAWDYDEDLKAPIYLHSTADMLPLDNAPGGYFPVSTFFKANDIVGDLPNGSSPCSPKAIACTWR